MAGGKEEVSGRAADGCRQQIYRRGSGEDQCVRGGDVAGGGIDAERSVTRPLMRAGVLECKREGGAVLGVFRLGGAAGWALW